MIDDIPDYFSTSTAELFIDKLINTIDEKKNETKIITYITDIVDDITEADMLFFN